MKIMKDYLMEVQTVDDGIKAILVGGGYIAQKLALVLHNRGLGCSVISRAKDLDLSFTPEFIFLFNINNEEIPEAVLNFSEAIKSKLIIVSLDKPCGDNLIKLCLEKDVDYCSVSIYDVFGGSGTTSALENIFLGVGKGKLISFSNDQIAVTPVFVDDIVEALCRIAFSTQTFKKDFLLTGKEELPLVGFAQRIGIEVSQSRGLLLKPEEFGQDYLQPISRHEKILKRDETYLLLGWRPETDIVGGIKLALGSSPVKECPPSQLPEVKKKTVLSL